jgi:superfamily I DNA/RNA helicase
VAERLETRSALLRPWRKRCEHLLVDETQDVDRSQLRLALLLAAPDNRIFLVGGDDDQKIYGWRLADERRHPVAGRWHGYDLTVALCCGPVTTHASW